MAEEENMIFMKSILSVSQAVEIPSEVQEGLNKCIYIIVNCLKQEANEDNVKRLIVEELKERKIRLWIDSIKVKNTSAFIKVNSFPGNELQIQLAVIME